MRDSLHFIKQSLANFRQTGALMPSGGALTRAMVAAVPVLPRESVIIELGPGTGVFTRELHQRFPHNRLLAIEFNSEMAQRLRERMPMITVIEGCASRLNEHLHRLGLHHSAVGAVVSGLPLLSLPGDLRDAIFSSIAEVLPPNRRYIQFTYLRSAWNRYDLPQFRREETRRVWLNMPPASVLTFTRIDEPALASA